MKLLALTSCDCSVSEFIISLELTAFIKQCDMISSNRCKNIDTKIKDTQAGEFKMQACVMDKEEEKDESLVKTVIRMTLVTVQTKRKTNGQFF